MALFNIVMIPFTICSVIMFQGCDSDVTCKNDSGHDVDWFILYKLPAGLSYYYMDESTSGWRLSAKQIDSVTGALGNTLKPLLDFYDKKTEGFGYMLYNDQPSNKKGAAPSRFGHSKGVVLLNRMGGVWLSHSTPRFPNYRRKVFWPKNANANAQTFMCVTYPYEQFNQIGIQLKYIRAYSFDSDLPTTFDNNLRCVAQQSCVPRGPPWFSVMTLTSKSGRKFSSFAKYTRFGDDLYSGLIVNKALQNLYVKSWGRMRHPLPSNCTTTIPHHVYNVKKLMFTQKICFNFTQDHSKWSVTVDGSWTCIADMNREESQMKRGGGAICTDNPVVGKAFVRLIPDSGYEKC
ncbi:deoxyribonuclease-2-alpha-like isoform X2 [Gouania willdenowi]|uniref:Deoxyribonuclease-2-alpha n=1 Tax=Gouania willdenowi TaxID=441366 RepID=A0A8C5NCJ5_GOUWI|nr:deoxyribonuclease-2-alpha-like isoform X2 [Gouania willdenowi]